MTFIEIKLSTKNLMEHIGFTLYLFGDGVRDSL